MGRYCNLTVSVLAPAEKEAAVTNAVEWIDSDKWDSFDAKDKAGYRYIKYCEDENLSWSTFMELWEGDGRDEIAKQIWTAVGSFCPIEVQVSDLEETPTESSEYEEDEYGDWWRETTGSYDLTQAEWDAMDDEARCHFMLVDDIATANAMWNEWAAMTPEER